MEPICWTGIVGIVAIGAVICSFFKDPCKNHSSSCGCDSKKDSTQSKETSISVLGIDDKKEKEINDLTK